MKITYLGTAAAEGWPGLFCGCEACARARAAGGKNMRSRSQALIDDELLVDFPPDSYWHMSAFGLDLPSIRQLIVTHGHQDHFYPLDLMLRGEPFSHIEGKTAEEKLLHVYGNDAVRKSYEEALASSNPSFRPGIALEYREVPPFKAFDAGSHRVIPLLANHNKAERCYIYEIESGGKRLLYANDTGLFPEETWDFIAGRRYDLVSMDCTMLSLKDGGNHMGIADTAELCDRLRSISCLDAGTKLVITHFSHNGRLLHEEIEESVAELGYIVAYDGLSVEF